MEEDYFVVNEKGNEQYQNGRGNRNKKSPKAHKSPLRKGKDGVKGLLKKFFNSGDEEREGSYQYDVEDSEGVADLYSEYQKKSERSFQQSGGRSNGDYKKKYGNGFGGDLFDYTESNRKEKDRRGKRKRKRKEEGSGFLILDLEPMKELPSESESKNSTIPLSDLESPGCSSKQGGWFDSLKLEEKEEIEKLKNSDGFRIIDPKEDEEESEGEENEKNHPRSHRHQQEQHHIIREQFPQQLVEEEEEEEKTVSFQPMRDLENLGGHSSYLNSTMQLLQCAFYYMDENEKKNFQSSEFSEKIGNFLVGKEGQKETYSLIEALTGLETKSRDDGGEMIKPNAPENFIDGLFRIFEPQSLQSFSFTNTVEKIEQNGESEPVDTMNNGKKKKKNKKKFRRKKCILPVVSLPSTSSFETLQHGMIFFARSYGYPDKSFEILPRFIIVQCQLVGQLREESVKVYGFRKAYDYEVIGVSIMEKRHYTSILKGEKGEYHFCNNDEIQMVDSFSSVSCEYTKIVLLKMIEEEQKKMPRPSVVQARQDKPQQHHRKGTRIVVVKKIDAGRKIVLRFSGKPYVKVEEVQKCPNKRCKKYLKYEGDQFEESKYVECCRCHHCFCWLCLRDVPTCKKSSNDFTHVCV